MDPVGSWRAGDEDYTLQDGVDGLRVSDDLLVNSGSVSLQGVPAVVGCSLVRKLVLLSGALFAAHRVGLCPSKGARRVGVEDSYLQYRMTCWSRGMRASDDLSVKRAADPSPWAPRRSWAEP